MLIAKEPQVLRVSLLGSESLGCDAGRVAIVSESTSCYSLGTKLVAASTARSGTYKLCCSVQLYGLESGGIVWSDRGADDEEEGVRGGSDAEGVLGSNKSWTLCQPQFVQYNSRM